MIGFGFGFARMGLSVSWVEEWEVLKLLEKI
jgi:hypothetical protein